MDSTRIDRGVWVVLAVNVLISPFVLASKEMAAVPVELPAPLYIGTQENIEVPNLEKYTKKARPPFYAPADVRNVSLHKPVSSTDDMPIIGELEMITDGDKEGTDGSFVELGPFLQHVTVDLEGEFEIYAILVWHYHANARVFFDVVVQVADDADFVENVRTLFNNDMDNSAGLGVGKDWHYVETNQGRLIDAKGCRGRYVRLYSQGNQANDLNQYIEVEVWGRPIEKAAVPECEELMIEIPQLKIHHESWHLQKYKDFSWQDSYYHKFMVPVGTRNLALGKKVTSSDPQEPIIGDLGMIVDDDREGDEGSIVEIGPGLQHVVVDMGDVYELYGICVWRDYYRWAVYEDVIVEISCDADFVENVILFNNDHDNSAGMGAGVDRIYLEPRRGKMINAAGLRGRYVRVWSRGSRTFELNRYVEIGAYGKECEDGASDDRLIPLNFELPVEPRVEVAWNWSPPPNMERPSAKERETFFAPVGTRKISVGKPVVTGSKEAPTAGRLEMITDGDKDCGKDNYVELGPFLQQVTIDLEAEYQIRAILLWHWLKYNGPRVYFDVIVQVSNDFDFVEGVHTVFNNDIDNSAGFGPGDDMHYLETYQGRLIDAGGVRGRFVRIYSNGNTSNDLNHYTEVEVYGL